MPLSIRDEQGNIASWVWLAVGAVIFVVVFILFRGSGASSSNPQVTDTGTSNLSDEIANLEQEILALQNGSSNVPKDTGKDKKKNPTNPIPGSITLNITKGTSFFDKLWSKDSAGKFAVGQHVIAILVKSGKYNKWYKILSGPRTGEFIKIPIPAEHHKKNPHLGPPNDHHHIPRI